LTKEKNVVITNHEHVFFFFFYRGGFLVIKVRSGQVVTCILCVD